MSSRRGILRRGVVRRLPACLFRAFLHQGGGCPVQRKISTSAIDECYERARAAGAIGGKLLGAGGGGFLLLFVPPAARAAVTQALPTLREVPIKFERGGSRILVYQTE